MVVRRMKKSNRKEQGHNEKQIIRKILKRDTNSEKLSKGRVSREKVYVHPSMSQMSIGWHVGRTPFETSKQIRSTPNSARLKQNYLSQRDVTILTQVCGKFVWSLSLVKEGGGYREDDDGRREKDRLQKA